MEMETVRNEDLYIWHFFVGCPGSMNDINMLQKSLLYQDVTAVLLPPRDRLIPVDGVTRSLL